MLPLPILHANMRCTGDGKHPNSLKMKLTPPIYTFAERRLSVSPEAGEAARQVRFTAALLPVPDKGARPPHDLPPLFLIAFAMRNSALVPLISPTSARLLATDSTAGQ